MSEYSINLGKSIYKNRKRQRLTQAQLAEKTGVTEQTIRKIEHGEGNPQFEVVCALVTTLMIDPAEIFYPHIDIDDPCRKQLEMLFSQCNKCQIEAVIPIVCAAIKVFQGELINATK